MTFHQIHPRNHYLCHRPSSLGYTSYYHRWRSLHDRKWVLGWGSSAHHCHPHSHFGCHSASMKECTVLRGHTQTLKVHRKYLQQKRIGHKDICFYRLLNEIDHTVSKEKLLEETTAKKNHTSDFPINHYSRSPGAPGLMYSGTFILSLSLLSSCTTHSVLEQATT